MFLPLFAQRTMKHQQKTIDGNEAAAFAGYKTNEVIAIYPITPASQMGEFADAWSTAGLTNVWGTVPTVREMQSEGGASGADHGALTVGSLCTSFTSSQGLLLMIPNMFKIAGELTPAVIHVASRAVGSHALTIYVEHSDVMATRATGWGMFFGNTVQEVLDFGLIAQAATLECRVPFLNVFDGFRTSHEVQKIDVPADDEIRALISDEAIRAHRKRGLTPDKPIQRGTIHNSDVFFQFRERQEPFLQAAPGIIQSVMDRFAALTGRKYRLFDYAGAPDADRVVVLMGSSCETAEETVRFLASKGEKVGVVKVRIFRPFSIDAFISALPKTVKSIAVLDRTKEHGSAGEPLYQNVSTAVCEAFNDGRLAAMPKVAACRYGLGGKEFTPGMVKAILDEIAKTKPRAHFTIGIVDDVSHSNLDYDPSFTTEPGDVFQAIFFGLGSDGTVSANKNTIKIIGEETDDYVQAYFLYDSKKSGSVTESHLRFGPRPIQSTYLIDGARFLGVHQFGIFDVRPVFDRVAPGATVLINSPFPISELWDRLSRPVQETIIAKKLKLYMIDAGKVAQEVGLGNRISAIMQTAFFALSEVLPHEEALEKIRVAVKRAYGHRGQAVVEMNLKAIDKTVEEIHEIPVPAQATSARMPPPPISDEAPEFMREFIGKMVAGKGDELPVSMCTVDGEIPLGSTEWEKRNLVFDAPAWNPELCIQCGKCVFVCPHSVIRAKILEPEAAAKAPEGFLTAPCKFKEFLGKLYSIQVSAADCTGCELCVETCPTKDKTDSSRKALNIERRPEDRALEKARWDYFLKLPDVEPHSDVLKFNSVRNVQILKPLIEFSGACQGCGETPYAKLMTQLFGDRIIVANAAGCSSVWGSMLPTNPYTVDAHGRGPAFCSSLFEDNAEFGYGYRLGYDKQGERARLLLGRLGSAIPADVAEPLLEQGPEKRATIEERRRAVERLRAVLAKIDSHDARELEDLADKLIEKSVWILGGDGWAYDIGFGGLDHVIASGENVNLLVLDTEVYSNTGGQSSKASPRGSVAKFTTGGKPSPKKDLGRMAMSYGSVYVAQIAFGANDAQTVRAFVEAESYDGPSLIIAYCHCIAHGIDMTKALTQHKLAVESGHWPLYRYDPRRTVKGENPFQLDSRAPSVSLEEYLYKENRYRILSQTDPAAAQRLLELAKRDVAVRWHAYEQMAASHV
jgi:pyruvate-ferredoxin/flavodoxin oxidoreductase